MHSFRNFYIIGLLIIIASSSWAVIYGSNYIENHVIKKIAADNNSSVVKIFTATMWRKHKDLLALLPCQSSNCPDITTLKKDMKNFAEKLGLFSMSLYSKEGQNFLSPNTLIDKNNNDYEDFIKSLEGNVSSKVVLGAKNGAIDLSTIRTFFPITVGKKGHIIAIAVAEYEITDLWSSPKKMQALIIAAILVVFLGIFVLMNYIIHKSEQVIAKQYEANASLIEEKTSAEEENREKSQFLANISHELRTPLNAIIGFSEIIKDEVMGPLENDQYKEYIKDINVSGVHLLSLINDILDYSKAEAGKLNVSISEVNITKIMKNSLRLVIPRAGEAKINLIETIPKEHHILRTDGKRIKQVLLNLLSNAVKFTPEGGDVKLNAWSNVKDNTFIIEVTDTGVGIDEKDISKVMATFGQVENKLSRKYEGTGLGLPLSHKLVELMGGKLDIRSVPGEGTVVTVSLPQD